MKYNQYITFSEAELISGLNKGKKEVFHYLFNFYYCPLYQYVLKIIHDADASKDILQEVFTSLWINRKEIQIRSSLESYIFRMARNKCINYLKKQTMQKQYLGTADLNLTAPNNPLDQLQFKEFQQALRNHVELFPQRQKQVFMLSREEGLSHKEIASKLNLSVKTVETHLFRSLKDLKNSLKKIFPSFL